MSKITIDDLRRAGLRVVNGAVVPIAKRKAFDPRIQQIDDMDESAGIALHSRIAKASKPRMNRTETELYGMLKERGYQKVEFEGITLTLAAGARYTPDFYTYQIEEDTLGNYTCFKTTFFEAKGGFIREASLVRLKVAARMYPEFQFVLAQKKKGVWREKCIEP